MGSKALIAIVAALIVAGVSVLTVGGSSHREAPLITQDPLADNTDVYAFRSPDNPDTVTLIANWIPLEEPGGGPNFFNFDDNARYLIKIDNNGDAVEDITYEWTFNTTVRNPNTFLYNTGPIFSPGDPRQNVVQTYTVKRFDSANPGGMALGSNLISPPNNIGPASTPNYQFLAEAAVHDLGNGVKTFSGQRDDPFYVDLGSIFDLLTIRQPPGNSGAGVDGLGGFNVHSIALQVPITDLTQGEDPVIGVWSTTERRRVNILGRDGNRVNLGSFRQVSRLGMPLVNEVVIPLGQKDKFNASQPRDDAQFLNRVTDPELAALLNLIHPLNSPTTGRDDLVAVFLTGIDLSGLGGPNLNQPANVVPSEMLRLNTSIEPTDPAQASRLGVLGGDLAGFPNGRRLADDVVDIELQAVCGVTYVLLVDPGYSLSSNCAFVDPQTSALVPVLGDGVDANDVPFLPTFPYLGTPHQGFDHNHHPITPGPFTATTAALGLGSGLVFAGIALGAVFTLRRRRGSTSA